MHKSVHNLDVGRHGLRGRGNALRCAIGPHRIEVMISPYWPLSGLRLRTPRLELHWPTLRDLDALAGLAAEGVHDPDLQPFTVAWTDATPAERSRSVLQYHWRQWAAWEPSDWTLDLVVDHGGVIVGTQGLSGRDFAIRREVSTGSWIGQNTRVAASEPRCAPPSCTWPSRAWPPSPQPQARTKTTPPLLQCRENSATATTGSNGTSSAVSTLCCAGSA